MCTISISELLIKKTLVCATICICETEVVFPVSPVARLPELVKSQQYLWDSLFSLDWQTIIILFRYILIWREDCITCDSYLGLPPEGT
jgi:hypothetical protein